MKENYNPARILQDIQMIKYKKVIIPIALIIISLFLQKYVDQAKYLSAVGLVLYFYISFVVYRISRNIPPETDREVFLSPIFGTVQSVNDNKVTIAKSQFSLADFRLGISREKFEIECSGKLTILDKVSDIPGRLIGLFPGKGTLVCTIPEGFEFDVFPGTRLLAGETILAMGPAIAKIEVEKENEEL